MTEEKIPNLAAKLCAITEAIGRIPKTGTNTFHGYDYATEAAISEAIRMELASRRVAFIPEVTDCRVQSVGDSALTVLSMTYTFRDADSCEEIQRQWVGTGCGKGGDADKGAYKAMTGAVKYILMKTFLIPTGDDPETVRESSNAKTKAAHVTPTEVVRDDPAPMVPNDDWPSEAYGIVGMTIKREGEGKNGKPYVIWLIELVSHNGTVLEADCFGNVATKLRKAWESGTPIVPELREASNPKYNPTLESFELAVRTGSLDVL